MRIRLFTTAMALSLGLTGAVLAQEGAGLQNIRSTIDLGHDLGRQDLGSMERRPEELQDVGLTDQTGRKPRLAQKDSFVSSVYLTHSSCGSDCWTYEMTEDQAALTLATRISFTCAPGDSVAELRLIFPDDRSQAVYRSGGGRKQRHVAKMVVLEPWTPDQIRERAAEALGGDWQGPRRGQGGNVQSAYVALRQSVLVEGRCRIDPTPRTQSFQLDSVLSVIDTAWTLPPP